MIPKVVLPQGPHIGAAEALDALFQHVHAAHDGRIHQCSCVISLVPSDLELEPLEPNEADLLRRGHKIQAIRAVRERFPSRGLRYAKACVDHAERLFCCTCGEAYGRRGLRTPKCSYCVIGLPK